MSLLPEAEEEIEELSLSLVQQGFTLALRYGLMLQSIPDKPVWRLQPNEPIKYLVVDLHGKIYGQSSTEAGAIIQAWLTLSDKLSKRRAVR